MPALRPQCFMVGSALDHQFDHRAIEEKRLEADIRDVSLR